MYQALKSKESRVENGHAQSNHQGEENLDSEKLKQEPMKKVISGSKKRGAAPKAQKTEQELLEEALTEASKHLILLFVVSTISLLSAVVRRPLSLKFNSMCFD